MPSKTISKTKSKNALPKLQGGIHKKRRPTKYTKRERKELEGLVGQTLECEKEGRLHLTSMLQGGVDIFTFGGEFTREGEQEGVPVVAKGSLLRGRPSFIRWGAIRHVIIYNSLKNTTGFPKPLVASFTSGEYDFQIMERLGKSLQHYVRLKTQDNSEESLVSKAFQMVALLQKLHRHCGWCHLDISLGNFVFETEDRGDSNGNFLSLIDFEICNQVVPPIEPLGFNGTRNYASKAAHQNQASTYSMDLESTVYVLHHYSTGSLPWQGEAISKKGLDIVFEKKKAFRPSHPLLLLLQEYASNTPFGHVPLYLDLINDFLRSYPQWKGLWATVRSHYFKHK